MNKAGLYRNATTFAQTWLQRRNRKYRELQKGKPLDKVVQSPKRCFLILKRLSLEKMNNLGSDEPPVVQSYCNYVIVGVKI